MWVVFHAIVLLTKTLQIARRPAQSTGLPATGAPGAAITSNSLLAAQHLH